MVDHAMLDFAGRFVGLHQDAENGSPIQVIPAVHDALEMDHEALEAIATRYDGRYIRCDDLAPVRLEARGPINSGMAEHLVQLCANRNMPIRLTEEDGQVVAVAEDYGEPTGSLPMMLRVLAFLASAGLECPLVVLSYSLVGLDEVRAALLWEATLAPGIFGPPQLRTFVPIAGGEVDVSAHCNRLEGSARLVVREGELIERAPSRTLADSLRMILPDVSKPIVLFLGAGFSASSDIPQGNRLRDLAIASLTGRDVGSIELIPAFRHFLDDHERWMTDEKQLPLDIFERNLTLERVLREEFYALSGRDRSESGTLQRMRRDCSRALDRQPPGRQSLWKLAGLLPRLVIVTVNFDQQAEMGMAAGNIVIVNRDDLARNRDLVVSRLKGDPTPLPILKLHGSIDNFESLVADINSTSRGLPAEMTIMLDSIVSTVGYMPWVWIGCSMRDADVTAWLAGKSGRTDLLEWWVDPLPPLSVQIYAKRWRWKDWAEMDQTLRDRQITEVSDRFLSALVSYVETRLADRGRQSG
jgi:hypothetical protein